MDERMAPELLRWNEELIGRLMQNLEAQTEAASVLLSSGATSKPDEHERLLLVQMEIERVRWLLRSYLRTRTFKIEKQAQYLLKTPLARNKMSDVEQGYAERYHALVIKHFQNSVTGNIPERLGRLDEDEMVVRPELDQAVFARARRDCPPITLPDMQLLEMKKGEIHLVRYRSVRALVRDGYVRLV
ncbi:GINS complex, Sld5 component [Cystobasidium minutum MCA 4210]|uniref:GINS complex, Sld5 component n=1 Tax=Cystobasidium minutum MCA 4210 TaxID=1397322 RepID=UPI0034CD81E4|eukprot:jgi/Rhomi1/85237/CE85236_1399